MYYPTIFPSELAVQHHFFIVNGNGMEWINGELISSPSMKDKPERTRKSVLGYHRDEEERQIIDALVKAGLRPLLFSSCGRDNITWLYPYCEYARLEPVLKGEVEPTLSWKVGIHDFCSTVLTWSLRQYKYLYKLENRGYYGYSSESERWKREKDNFKKIYKICKTLHDRFNDDYYKAHRLEYQIKDKIKAKKTLTQAERNSIIKQVMKMAPETK